MVILQIIPRIPFPPKDGGAVYIYNTSKHLALQGNDLVIAAFISNQIDQDIAGLEKYATVYAEDGKFKPYGILAVLKSTLTQKPISIQHRMDKTKMEKRISSIDEKPDIILLEGLPTAAFIASLKHKFPNIPLVLRQSNVEYLLLKRNAIATKNIFLKIFYYHQSFLMKRFEISAMRKVDAVTAITQFDKDVYLEHLPELNCFVSPAGSDVLHKKKDIRRKKNNLLAISYWKWKPNLDGLDWFLKNVWPELVKKQPSITFDIIGEGLSEKFKQEFNDPRINFLGFVDSLESYRQSATIFVAPLFSGSGMKLKIVEALAYGLPIITTKIGAEGISIENEMHYIEANTEMEFVNKILALLNDFEMQELISKKATEVVVQNYAWPAITAKLISYLNSLRNLS